MTLGELRKLTKSFPDETEILIQGMHSVTKAKVKAGRCKPPDKLGQTNFMENGVFISIDHEKEHIVPAVYVTYPR